MSKRLDRHAQGDRTGGRTTVLREPVWSTVCVYAAFGAVGAGVGWLADLLADWLVALPWAPLRGPAELVTAVPTPPLVVAGAVAGLAFGGVAQYEQLVIRLSADEIVLTCKGRRQEFPYDAVATAFRDGRQLVLLGHDGSELARQNCGLDAARVAAAFTAHGCAWADADPYADEFRRWVPGAPGLPQGADAILAARQKSLEGKGSSGDDTRELREDLARLGVVVRDESRRQYWRTVRVTGRNAD